MIGAGAQWTWRYPSFRTICPHHTERSFRGPVHDQRTLLRNRYFARSRYDGSVVARRAFREGGAKGRTEVPKIVDWYMDGKINIDDLITHTLPLEDVNKAFDLMHAGESIRSVVQF